MCVDLTNIVIMIDCCDAGDGRSEENQRIMIMSVFKIWYIYSPISLCVNPTPITPQQIHLFPTFLQIPSFSPSQAFFPTLSGHHLGLLWADPHDDVLNFIVAINAIKVH